MQPWALGIYRLRQRTFLPRDPMLLSCKPPGGPRQFQQPYGFQFVEQPDFKRVFVLLGGGNRNRRTIYTDGRKHVGQIGGNDDNPLFYGHGVARWEGDTFVVDMRAFNEEFWFDNGGLPHTEQLQLDRTVHAHRHGDDAVRGDDRRSRRVYAPVEEHVELEVGARRRDAIFPLPGQPAMSWSSAMKTRSTSDPAE